MLLWHGKMDETNILAYIECSKCKHIQVAGRFGHVGCQLFRPSSVFNSWRRPWFDYNYYIIYCTLAAYIVTCMHCIKIQCIIAAYIQNWSFWKGNWLTKYMTLCNTSTVKYTFHGTYTYRHPHVTAVTSGHTQLQVHAPQECPVELS